MPKLPSKCIYNRSPYAVSVKNRPDLYREFPGSAPARAHAYADDLKRQGCRPACGQLANAFQLMLREKGSPAFVRTFATLVEAEETLEVLRGQRQQKIYIDYSPSLNATLAELIARYIDEECSKHKGGKDEAARLRAWLEDSRGRGGSRAARLADEVVAHEAAGTVRAKRRTDAKRDFIENLEFLHKPLAAVQPMDFEEFILGRMEQVKPGTVDRELDLFAQVINTADKTWRIRCAEPPMHGVRRPRYFNERDRRLAAGEELRLCEAARDDENSLLEPAIRLLLLTAMRSSELVRARWADVDFDRAALQLHDTKNGRPRKVPLTAGAIQVLRALPRTDERILPLSANGLKKGWERVIAATQIKNLHKHDLRHEAISRLAETGKFSVLDLQAISGHRDIRMLQRYSHLCTALLAARMEEVASPTPVVYEYCKNGRERAVRQASPKPPAQLHAQGEVQKNNVIAFRMRRRVA